MKEPLVITEKSGIHEQWFVDAKNVRTSGELKTFVDHLINDYSHDYGTICHAVSAAAVAAAWCVEHSPTGGITGFQAGCVMWGFMEHWNGPLGPARLVKYENALYPQYRHSFRGITGETWEWLQNEAKKKLAEKDHMVDSAVVEHWQSIAKGKIPFGLEIES